MITGNTRVYSIVVVDGSSEYRGSLLELLAYIPGIRVVAAGANEIDAVALCALHEPDILLIDSGIPAYGALSSTRAVKARSPGMCIVLMTSDDVRDFTMLHRMTPADRIISKSDIKSSILDILSDLDRDAARSAH
ncbi:MAG: response regulator [Bacteroidetes bacterium]|nr:response regulator [Bacteroidota bacterium]